jgi:hypothetical protein
MRESLSLSLLGIYLGIVAVLQVGAVMASQLVGLVVPAASLMAFLVLFIAVFAAAWPIAVRVAYLLMPETADERAARLEGHAVARHPGRAYRPGRAAA